MRYRVKFQFLPGEEREITGYWRNIDVFLVEKNNINPEMTSIIFNLSQRLTVNSHFDLNWNDGWKIEVTRIS